MAVVNPPGWLQNAGATHTAAQLRTYFGALFDGAPAGLISAGGVSPNLGNKLLVTQSGTPGMSVIVKSGVAVIPGSESGTQGVYGVINDADVTVGIAASDPTLPRIDIICFKVQDSQYSGSTNTSSLVAVTGTPAASPSVPTAPANSITLYQVAVGAAVTSILNANLTDVRPWLSGIVRLPDNQIFTASGTWTKPRGAKIVRVICVGGGGAGGGAAAAASGENSKGSGGGGGSYGESVFDASTLTSTVTITVGAGGVGAVGANGNNGNQSSFGALVIGRGGVAGSRAASSSSAGFGIAGGAGGLAGTGQLGGVGGAGENAIGSGTLGVGGSGGSSRMGGGGKGTATGTTGQSITGTVGGLYGGGGGGGLSTSTGAACAGGDGGAGVVIVTTFFQ
jgi:hypothetical protein